MAKEPLSLPDDDAALQEKAANLTITAVRSLTSRDRTRCSASGSSCSLVLAGTKREKISR